jgi:hypothetical protein
MTWLKLEFATIVVVMAIVTGGLGTLIVRGLLAQPSPAPVAPAASTNAPALSPLDPILIRNAAVVRNDADAFLKTYAPGTSDENIFALAAQSLLIAQGKTLAAYGSKIDPNGKSPLTVRAITPMSDDEMRSALLTMIDDHTADYWVPGSYRYRMSLIDGQWRVQAAATFASKYPADPAKALQVQTKLLLDLASAMDTTTAEINAGTLTEPKAVATALQDRFTKIGQAASAEMPLPVVAVPFKFANAWLSNSADPKSREFNDYQIEVDPTTRRTPDSSPAGHLRSRAAHPAKGSAVSGVGAGAPMAVGIEPLRGKRIRLTCWIKTKDVENWCGASLIVLGDDKKLFAQADNGEQPIFGTTGWQQLQFVADVPTEATSVYVAASLFGEGEMWFDDFQVEIVPDSVLTNDDQLWQKWSPISPQYTAAIDPQVRHGNHLTICLSSDTAPRGQWCSYGQNNRMPDEFLGGRIKMTAWIKTENVTDRCGICLRMVVGGNSEQIAYAEDRNIVGTTDWHLCTVIIDVPPQTQCISSSFLLYGKGKLWLDRESAKYEIVNDPAIPAK